VDAPTLETRQPSWDVTLARDRKKRLPEAFLRQQVDDASGPARVELRERVVEEHERSTAATIAERLGLDHS
jgi:hypothetical protein